MGANGSPARRHQSNIPARRNLPFHGRNELLDKIASSLGDPQTDNVIVLHGQPGVGKSELAFEFARRHRNDYPGGTFFIDAGEATVAVDLAKIGRACLGIDFPPGLPLDDQAQRTLYTLGQIPWLLILDNVQSEEAARPWLPPAGMPCHVIMTTPLDIWDISWRALPVEPLTDAVSLQLVEELAGSAASRRHGQKLVAYANGLPVQLVPQSITLAAAVRRGRDDAFVATLGQETARSFRGVYDLLDSSPRLLLHAAARLNTQRIVGKELACQLADGAGWNEAEYQRSLDACLNVHVLEGADELRMHRLFASFLCETDPGGDVAPVLSRVVSTQAKRMINIAGEVAAAPNRSDLAGVLMTYPTDISRWDNLSAAISVEGKACVARALVEIGQFAAARPWYERTAAETGKGDVHGRVDHESFGSSLHQVGYCLSRVGEFAAARPWFERAVEEKRKGDVRGRVDHVSLGSSMHRVGVCLSSTGEFAAAHHWFERAVEEKRKGDVCGRGDHVSLGSSLHRVGDCLSSTGEFAAARPWFERAVEEKKKGDVHGRINHASLGLSLHQVGDCLSSTGEFAAAHHWFERAVEEKRKGDVHGRVNHASLGFSLHQVGYCLSSTGDFAAARSWFERAVAEAEKGDAYGRVDHESLGSSLHQVGDCLDSTGDFAAARPWYERAAEEKKKGDVHSRVDHTSLGSSLHQVGYCLSSTGDFATARSWYERAVAEAEKGDVHGRVDHECLGSSLHLVGDCLASIGEFAAARPWYERAVAEAEKGDVHGRVDHASLGTSLHQVGDCLDSNGEFAAARPWYERAVAEKEKGDVHGRVDHESLGVEPAPGRRLPCKRRRVRCRLSLVRARCGGG
jgi:tetratricopeptide (TPR) repeat protein